MAHQTVRWCTRQGIVHYPMPATSADRWGLKRLTIEVLCLLAAPDMSGAYWLCCFDFWLLHCALLLFTQSTVEHRWPLLHWHTGHVRCTPDSPMNYNECLLGKPESGQLMRCSAWAPDSVRCTTGITISSLFSNHWWVPNSISFLVYVEPYAPKINDI
jgi:hypothetical protein